ncbi:MAG: helix-turn-helix domain-containing protein, partial [Mesorhizobium sp.]
MTVKTVAPARADRKKSPKAEIHWRQRPFLPLITAAELLGLSPSSLYRMESEGKLTFNKLGGRTLVAVASVIKLIDT